MTLYPQKLAGTLAAPPSKSAAQRLLIAAALADRETVIEHIGDCDDVQAVRRCLTALGASFTKDADTVTVTPVTAPAATATLPCGESGAALRFLLPLAAALGCRATFTGADSLLARPLGDLPAALAQGGVTFFAEPHKITVSGKLTGGEFSVRGNVSSQIFTGLLMALPTVGVPSRLAAATPPESAGYIRMTCDVMARFGVSVKASENTWRIPAARYRSPLQVTVPGDWSAAAVWLAAGALGGPVCVGGLSADTAQGDRAILDILRQFGAEIEENGTAVTVRGGSLRAVGVDMRDIPDLLPPLAILATAANGVSVFHGAARTRLKECDRLAGMAAMIRALGGTAIETADTLTVYGTGLRGGIADTRGDHRLVMAAALASVIADGAVTVMRPDTVCKSYPAFWRDFCALRGAADEHF